MKANNKYSRIFNETRARTKHYNDANDTFVVATTFPSGLVQWQAGVVKKVSGYSFDCDFDKFFDDKEAAIASIRGQKRRQANKIKYADIPGWWRGDAQKIARRLVDAGIEITAFASSQCSDSKYITTQQNIKIRMSDHVLPALSGMEYDEVDIYHFYGGDISQTVNRILEAEKAKKAKDTAYDIF